MRYLAVLLVILTGTGMAERFDTVATIVLENDLLMVELYADRPAPLTYLHKPTGERMVGAGPDGVWRINGQDIPWSRWRIKPFRRSDWSAAAYEMALSGTDLRLQARFILRDSVLEMRLENIDDPKRRLQSIEWIDMPLLVCRSPEYTYWRELWRGARWREGSRAVWRSRPESSRIGDARTDAHYRPTMHACVYKKDALCAFVTSNCRLFPLLNRVQGPNRYEISLNAYLHLEDAAEPFRAAIGFLHDLNGDGVCDHNDYALWVNRHLPDPPDDRLKTALWYKLDAAAVKSVDDVEGIARRIANLTGGIPQVCRLSARMDSGGEEHLGELAGSMRRHNAIIAWQTALPRNIGEPAHEGTLASLDEPNAQPATLLHQPGPRMHATGDPMTLHLSGFGGGTIERQEWADQLYRSTVQPIGELTRRGAILTAENTGGMPVQVAGLFSGLWRFEPPFELLPVYHGKVIAGCPAEAGGAPFGYGCGLKRVPALDDGDAEWAGLLDQIYLRALLYHFYLEREWLRTKPLPGGAVQLEFTGGTTVVAGPGPDDLTVDAEGVQVASGSDRFIPRGDVIYAYSRDGSKRWRQLPADWQGRQLRAVTLTAEGDGEEVPIKLDKHRIRLRLRPQTPVLISALPD